MNFAFYPLCEDVQSLSMQDIYRAEHQVLPKGIWKSLQWTRRKYPFSSTLESSIFISPNTLSQKLNLKNNVISLMQNVLLLLLLLLSCKKLVYTEQHRSIILYLHGDDLLENYRGFLNREHLMSN